MAGVGQRRSVASCADKAECTEFYFKCETNGGKPECGYQTPTELSAEPRDRWRAKRRGVPVAVEATDEENMSSAQVRLTSDQ